MFYLNKCNASAALRAFGMQNKVRKAKDPLSVDALKAMVAKFEKTGCLKVQSGRGRKSVAQGTTEEVAKAIVDRAQDNIFALPMFVGYLGIWTFHTVQYGKSYERLYTFIHAKSTVYKNCVTLTIKSD